MERRLFAKLALAASLVIPVVFSAAPAWSEQPPSNWVYEFPKTDFAIKSSPFSEILSGGPPRDGIPSIDDPVFKAISDVDDLKATEPVIGLIVNGKARAYPLRVLMWHEIVNDVIGGVPVAVTYCPLCNSAVVFDRRFDGQVLSFGTTGKLRKSDLVMYDRQSETWWQQFLGEGLIGKYTGETLKTIPARLESFENFVKRAPDGAVLVPNRPGQRNYGTNPYVAYDRQDRPYPLFQGDLPDYINPMARIVVVDEKAWSMDLLREQEALTDGDLKVTWSAGQNSALDKAMISAGRDVGNVVVQRNGNDVVYDVTFAFVFHAFHPDKRIIME